MSTEHMNSNPLMLDHALLYVERYGFHVFPVRPNKTPMTPRGCLDATKDPEAIAKLWAENPDAGIGVACGPSGLVVIDVDPAHGGTESFFKLRATTGGDENYQSAVVSRTGGGGWHLFYKAPGDLQIRNSAGKLGDGIDVRADGGYVVLPPSPHTSGKSYSWLSDRSLHARPLSPVPSELLERIIEQRSPALVARGVDAVIPAGKRNDKLARVAGTMRRAGLCQEAITAALIAHNNKFCKPPLPGSEVERIASSISRYDPVPDEVADDEPWLYKSQADILAAGVAPVSWDFEGLLEGDSGPVLLFGPPESLKTWLAISAAKASVTGGMFLGQFQVRPRPKALYLNFDAGGKEFERRVAMLGSPIPNFFVSSPGAFSFDRLERALAENEGSFVVLDCFSDIYVPDRQSEPGRDMRAFVRGVRGLYERYGCNGVVVDHSRRWKPGEPVSSERYYGSIQKKAAIRQMWYVERLRRQDEPKGTARAKVVCEKLSEAERFESFIVDFTWEPELVHATYGGLYDEATAKGQVALKNREMIEPYMDPQENPDGVTVSTLTAKSGLSPKQVREALKTPGIVQSGKGKAIRYSLAPAVSDGDEELEIARNVVTPNRSFLPSP